MAAAGMSEAYRMPDDLDQVVAAVEGRATAYVAQLVQEIQQEMMVALLEQVQCCAISCAKISSEHLTSLQRHMLQMVVDQAIRRNGTALETPSPADVEDEMRPSALSPPTSEKVNLLHTVADENGIEASQSLERNMDNACQNVSQHFTISGASFTHDADSDLLSHGSASSPELISDAGETFEQDFCPWFDNVRRSEEADFFRKNRRRWNLVVFDAPPTVEADSEDVFTMTLRLRASCEPYLEAWDRTSMHSAKKTDVSDAAVAIAGESCAGGREPQSPGLSTINSGSFERVGWNQSQSLPCGKIRGDNASASTNRTETDLIGLSMVNIESSEHAWDWSSTAPAPFGKSTGGLKADMVNAVESRTSGKKGANDFSDNSSAKAASAEPQPPGLSIINMESSERLARSHTSDGFFANSLTLGGVWTDSGGRPWELVAAHADSGPCFASTNGRLQLTLGEAMSWIANFGYYEVPVSMEDFGQTLVFGNGQRWIRHGSGDAQKSSMIGSFPR
eukprot:TRINITY_DN10274_c0_g1_i1.p1 TRINITY_DN10274_c0_g1~~TRINITY_DN10274_c0_g1_i1.p1  ORF type:complete len:525 (+),score=99.65 TRINITY_DN10274_c0_g1_i1:56-1576(+)